VSVYPLTKPANSMSYKLYIGGLSWSTNDESLRAKFEGFGDLQDAIVIKDRETGRSRGFGFVTYESREAADKAVSTLNETEFEGRTIRVDHATERTEGDRRPRGTPYGSRGGSRGGFRSGGPGARSFGNGGGLRTSYGSDRSAYGSREGQYSRPRHNYDSRDI